MQQIAQSKITVTVNEETREILMSYGLVDELTRIVGNAESAPQMLLDPRVRNEVLEAIGAERTAGGRRKAPKEDAVEFDPGMSLDDANDVLDWALMHVTNFFMRQFKTTAATVEVHRAEIDRLNSSTSGSQA